MTVSRSELSKALRAGRDPAVDLVTLLRGLRNDSVKSAAEAREIVALLKLLPRKSAFDSGTSELRALTVLFQQVASEEAFEVLLDDGVPELCRLFDLLVTAPDEALEDDLLFLVKILAIFWSEEGTERVIAAARRPLKPESYLWSVILGQFNSEHPETDMLLEALRDPLPPDFIRVSLLDCANQRALEQKGAPFAHPFDTPAGRDQLRQWLSSDNELQFSYAHSAAGSLPFVSNPDRDQLLSLALDHTEVIVQMEGAWASARLGSEAGLKILRRYCLDLNRATSARHYLEGLEREDMIPEEAQDPGYVARAEFASWLAHPNELGRPPDTVEIVDQRKLDWPPDGEPRSLWILKYAAKDEEGEIDTECGLVGSVTFCLFRWQMGLRPPEDVYAIHCAWEMEGLELIEVVNAEQADRKLPLPIGQWRGEPLENPRVLSVARLAPELNYPQEVVTLVEATRDGEPGWAVLDGPRSRWYPHSEMPEGVPASTVRMLHVGRVLLEFTDEPDRKRYLAAGPRNSG